MTQDTWLERLLSLESAVLADVMTTAGLENQVLAPSFLPASSSVSLCGQALTCTGNSEAAGKGIPNFQLDQSITPGTIVIMDTQQCPYGAVLGDNMATSMIKRGALGFVVAGGIRDLDVFVSEKIPLFYQYTTPINAYRKWGITDLQCPITLPGIWGDVVIRPGDWLRGDGDGLVVIPREHIQQIVEDAEIHQQCEEAMKERISSGEDRQIVTQALKRLKHVRPIPKETHA